MRETEHPRNGPFALVVAFAGGALVGAVAAALFAPRLRARTRRLVTGAVDDTKEVAARVPRAIREASTAAQAAFAAALKESAGADAVE